MSKGTVAVGQGPLQEWSAGITVRCSPYLPRSQQGWTWWAAGVEKFWNCEVLLFLSYSSEVIRRGH